MTGEPGHPLRKLADEIKQVIRRHDLDDGDAEKALVLVVAEEIGNTWRWAARRAMGSLRQGMR